MGSWLEEAFDNFGNICHNRETSSDKMDTNLDCDPRNYLHFQIWFQRPQPKEQWASMRKLPVKMFFMGNSIDLKL